MVIQANIEEIVSVTLYQRERRLRDNYRQFRYSPGAHDRVCEKVRRALPEMADQSQIVDVIEAAVTWEERVVVRIYSEAAWSTWQEAA